MGRDRPPDDDDDPRADDEGREDEPSSDGGDLDEWMSLDEPRDLQPATSSRGERDAGQRDLTQIAIHVLISGLRAFLDVVAREHHVSYSEATRLLLERGLDLLGQEPWVAALWKAYETVRHRAIWQTPPDLEAVAQIDEVSTYEFRFPQKRRTNFSATRETQSRLARLAIASAISVPRLAVVVVAVGLLSLPNNRGYRGLLAVEASKFRRYVLHRTRLLRLPDVDAGPAPGTLPWR